MDFIKKNWFVFVAIIAVIIIVRSCEPKPIVKEKTVTVTKIVTDTIRETIIKEVPKTVYVERIKTVDGQDRIIYVDKPTDTSIDAKQYDTELKSNDASAKIRITALGEVLDVQGTITYPYKETTTTVTKIIPMSGLFVYGETSFLPMLQRAEIGVDYQIRNTVILGVSVSKDFITNTNYASAKIGIRIF